MIIPRMIRKTESADKRFTSLYSSGLIKADIVMNDIASGMRGKHGLGRP